MKIEQRIYKVFYKGKQFALSVFVSTGVKRREKVLIRSSKTSSFLSHNS